MEFFSVFDLSYTNLFVLFISLSLIIFLRYLFASGLYHYLVFKIYKKKKSSRVLQNGSFVKSQVQLEILGSALSSLIFSAVAVVTLILYLKDMTGIYHQWADYPMWYHPIGIFVILFLQDTYYYWVHRWMHKPGIYKLVHKWHHNSIQTSSMTSFSFHPYESAIQAVLFPILIVLIPIHIYGLLFVLIFMTITAIINHGAVEIYPRSKGLLWIRKWIIGATHHNQHHLRATYNYGLYFTFWDRLMKTEKLEFKEEN